MPVFAFRIRELNLLLRFYSRHPSNRDSVRYLRREGLRGVNLLCRNELDGGRKVVCHGRRIRSGNDLPEGILRSGIDDSRVDNLDSVPKFAGFNVGLQKAKGAPGITERLSPFLLELSRGDRPVSLGNNFELFGVRPARRDRNVRHIDKDLRRVGKVSFGVDRVRRYRRGQR